MGALGIAFGVGLAVASKRFHVDTDPRIEEVYEALPHIDCGACGYPGCSGYAEAVVLKGVDVHLCIPGGEETAHAVAGVMGVEVSAPKETARAVVHCQGGWGVAKREFDYAGVDDCRAAQLVQGGPKACKFGCLGLGTCASVCPFGAISMGEDGMPVVDEDKCTACGVCVKVCPVGIISILPSKYRVFMACSNPAAKGKAMKELCGRGCIKCRLCVKATESGAVTWGEALPEIDYETWTDPDAAVAKCPQDCFADQRAGAAGSLGAEAAG
jgi:Na+-translocating ferredoxin:NAD+ oxidoreductase RNF subunit RnfB